MRLILVLLVLAAAGLAALYAYGQMLEPDTHVIEQEAVSANSS